MMFAQFRPTDKTGINVFDSKKAETEFTGVKTTFGGGFTQSYQMLNHSNARSADVATVTPNVLNATTTVNVSDYANQRFVAGVDQNVLIPLVSGFNLASANLMINTQLADGVALNMELYLASRHHNETWVKGGYIQFDKLPFLNLDLVDNIMKYTTIKVGQMEVNYGDAHFRRSDGGNSIYNPFIENYIMDEFATEVGAEANVNYNGIVGVLGMTSGKLNSNIVKGTPVAGATDGIHKPAFLGKLGYDKQFTEDLRVRLTGSIYYTAGSLGQTMFGGDRTGSHYFGVMDFAAPSSSAFASGRLNPGLSDKLTTVMGNLFVKFRGLEWFSTYENANGRAKDEITGERNANQLASDLVYRFGKDENFWVGVRYNTVTAKLPKTSAVAAVAPAAITLSQQVAHKGETTAVAALAPYNVGVDRLAISAGWFVTKNVMAKLEYTNQNYDYANAPQSILNGGNFKGFVLEAVVGF
ncbi:MAG: hypothetical protein GZ091_01025 [Paludibacter sp.]|nr:hypothetical protein [Paludibacter sp.]